MLKEPHYGAEFEYSKLKVQDMPHNSGGSFSFLLTDVVESNRDGT